jgi:hypothetical protein
MSGNRSAVAAAQTMSRCWRRASGLSWDDLTDTRQSGPMRAPWFHPNHAVRFKTYADAWIMALTLAASNARRRAG